ncbi:unnamed protein product [Rangifer tarandus platyrhynchus]|uniref:Uncharacterized protein n=2 Tax=Rangifer tarandus platyrhynchus TaxID=3082113 RepID=A0ABN8YR76_RANTA|nr:unnamed protein product [Rangifer tarandus platyrhynchus]
MQGFPGSPVVKNPSSNAWDVSPILAPGTKILHAMEQLSPCPSSGESPHAATKTQCRQKKNQSRELEQEVMVKRPDHCLSSQRSSIKVWVVSTVMPCLRPQLHTLNSEFFLDDRGTSFNQKLGM